MVHNCDHVKQYAVRIEYHYNNEINLGSGVIVKPNNNSKICYVLTAKHNFEKSEDSFVKKEEIICDDISIYEDYGKKSKKFSCNSVEIINSAYDLAILFLNVEGDLLEVEPISILNDKFENCIIVGYPNIRKNKPSKLECYKCIHDKTNDDIDHSLIDHSLYEVQSDKPLEYYQDSGHDNIKGLSGGGVFTRGTEGKYYLVGIQIGIEEPINLRCLDLREIAEEINKCLQEEKIGLKGYSYSEKIGIDPALLDFDKIKGELKDKYIDEIRSKKPPEQLEYIKDNNSDFKKFDKKVQSYIKRIADTYLYRSILFHEYGDNKRATNNFKKAVEYNPSYYAYFAEAKFRRKRSAQELQIDAKNLDQLEERCNNALETEEDNKSKLELLLNLRLILSEKLTSVSDKQKKRKFITI